MVSEVRKQSMAWTEMDYSKHVTHFRWKIKWQLEHLGALGIMGVMVPLGNLTVNSGCKFRILVIVRNNNNNNNNITTTTRLVICVQISESNLLVLYRFHEKIVSM